MEPTSMALLGSATAAWMIVAGTSNSGSSDHDHDHPETLSDVAEDAETIEEFDQQLEEIDAEAECPQCGETMSSDTILSSVLTPAIVSLAKMTAVSAVCPQCGIVSIGLEDWIVN